MKKPTHILMYLAMGILLMHSMVPHHHSEEDAQGFSIEETEDPFSLVHFLEGLFGVDLGNDHLENFQTSRGMDSFGSLFFLTPESSPFQAALPVFTLQQKITVPRSLLYCGSPERPAFSLRGPPVSG